MLEINGRHLCESCFCEMNGGGACANCGYTPNSTLGDLTMLRPGSVLLRKYVIGKTIGKGGFGITYVAYDVTTQRKVAIKEFFPYGIAVRAPGTTMVTVSSADEEDVFRIGSEKFCNEAQMLSRFNGNPNIVGVHEFFYENNTVYFVMEYLQGHTLKEHIKIHGVLPGAQTLFIMNNVANALIVAHSANILHRDISPDNIILCDNGNVKLIDFGAARQVVAEHSQSFSVILKPGFAPLEQYQKKGNQGPWTDIYSLGATIYHALTGDILEDPMSRIDDDEEFSENIYDIEPELWAVIRKATQLKIEDRYSDIFKLKNDLNRISYQPQPIVVPTVKTGTQMPQPHTAVSYGASQPGVATAANMQYSAVSSPLNTSVNLPVQPQVTARPQVPVQPQYTVQSQATARPQATAQPQVTARPQTPVQPQYTVQSQATARPQATAQPQVTARPQTPVQPQYTIQPQIPVQQIAKKSNKTMLIVGLILAALAVIGILVVVLLSGGSGSSNGYTGYSSGYVHNNSTSSYTPSTGSSPSVQSGTASQSTAPAVPQTKMCDVLLKVKCEENTVANRYDIAILLDGRHIFTLPHGENVTHNLTLSEGSHVIEFRLASDDIFGESLYDPDNENTYKKMTLKVSDDMTASYMVKIALGNTVKVTRE